MIYNVHLGNPLIPLPLSNIFEVVLDDMTEEEECLLFTLSINETALDPRDQGQVDIANSVALIRIEDVMGMYVSILISLI